MLVPCASHGLRRPQMECMSAELVALIIVVGYLSPLLVPALSLSLEEAVAAASSITCVGVLVCMVSLLGRPWHQAYAWRRWPHGLAAVAAIMGGLDRSRAAAHVTPSVGARS